MTWMSGGGHETLLIHLLCLFIPLLIQHFRFLYSRVFFVLVLVNGYRLWGCGYLKHTNKRSALFYLSHKSSQYTLNHMLLLPHSDWWLKVIESAAFFLKIFIFLNKCPYLVPCSDHEPHIGAEKASAGELPRESKGSLSATTCFLSATLYTPPPNAHTHTHSHSDTRVAHLPLLLVHTACEKA